MPPPLARKGLQTSTNLHISPQLLAWYIQYQWKYQLTYVQVVHPPNFWHDIYNHKWKHQLTYIPPIICMIYTIQMKTPTDIHPPNYLHDIYNTNENTNWLTSPEIRKLGNRATPRYVICYSPLSKEDQLISIQTICRKWNWSFPWLFSSLGEKLHPKVKTLTPPGVKFQTNDLLFQHNYWSTATLKHTSHWLRTNICLLCVFLHLSV